jgi:zinc protease
MIRASILRVAVTMSAISIPLIAQQPAPPLTEKLPVSPEFVIGTLPNGFRYYIRKNDLPLKRAELRLVVNAGAILEDDDQQGYAHFLEHTAFNGTEHFKKNDLGKYLATIGVRFGADLNASTSFDETIYQLSIPTDTAKQFETAFQILEDWAHGQVFDSIEVVNERGVVREEWRGRLGAGERMQRVTVPIILKGSRYAERNIIGSEESIMRAQPSALKRFYADWYRPDLMAVVAVGDFDVPTVEALIKTHFSGLTMPRNPRPRTTIAVPANVTPAIAIASDAEMSSSSFNVGFKRPSTVVSTVGDYRARMVQSLYFAMLNARLREIARTGADAPFLAASAGMSGFFARNVDALTFGGAVKDGGIERGIEAVLSEARRANQFGFLPSEFQRAKDNMLRSAQLSYDNRTKTVSGAFVGQLIGAYLAGSALPGAEASYNLTRSLLPGITLDEVNVLGRDWFTADNRIALVNVPKKDGVAVPTEAQVIAAIDRGLNAQVTAYTENVSADPLLDRTPAPGRVVGSKTFSASNVTEWKLSNGARVLFKPTDFRADEVLFSAYSPGGTSLVSDADYLSAANASSIVAQSGLGRFNANDLSKKLSGKVASASASISSTSEGLAGSASPKDIETMFQLIHLRFTQPRLDTTAWLTMRSAMQQSLTNRNMNPGAAFSDTINVTLSQNNPRSRPPSLPDLDKINPQRALDIYKDRFSNAGDFTFVFVGNIVADSLKPLVEKYIASLPATGRVESWKDIGDGPPTGVVDKVVRKGTAPRANTQIYFTGPFDNNPRNRFELLAVTTLAQLWLTDALREEMGGTYSPGLGGSGSRIPRPEYNITISYTSGPDNVDKLFARAMRMIDSLQKYGPTETDLVKVKEQIIRGRETSLKTNGYWVSNILSRDREGEDIDGLLGSYDEMVKNLTAKQIQDAAKRYFNTARYAKFVLLPEVPRP